MARLIVAKIRTTKHRIEQPELMSEPVDQSEPVNSSDVEPSHAVLVAEIVDSAAAAATGTALAEQEAAYIRDDVLTGELARHGGRTIKLLERRLLAEFPDSAQAFAYAESVQRRLETHLRQSKEPLPLALRIGLHAGSVRHRAGDVFGPAVTVAAQLVKLCENGGICISQKVFEQVPHKQALRFEYAGRQDIRNVDTPIHIHQVRFARTSGRRMPGYLNQAWQWAIAFLLVVAVLLSLLYLTGGSLLTPDIPKD